MPIPITHFPLVRSDDLPTTIADLADALAQRFIGEATEEDWQDSPEPEYVVRGDRP